MIAQLVKTLAVCSNNERSLPILQTFEQYTKTR
jgi:hypothetical protein